MFGNLPREVLKIIFEWVDPNTTYFLTRLEEIIKGKEDELNFWISKLDIPILNKLVNFLPLWYKKERNKLVAKKLEPKKEIYWIDCQTKMGIFVPFFKNYTEIMLKENSVFILIMLIAEFPYANLKVNCGRIYADIYASRNKIKLQTIINQIDKTMDYLDKKKYGISKKNKELHLQRIQQYPFLKEVVPPENYVKYCPNNPWIYIEYPKIQEEKRYYLPDEVKKNKNSAKYE